LEEFAKASNRKDGLQPYCRACHKRIREADKERLKDLKREYYYRDHEAMKQKLRDRYAANPEKVLYKQRAYYSTLEGRQKKIWMKARETASKKNLEFNIEVDDIQIPTHCPYLGVELTHDLGKGQLPTNSSIDRIDSTKGYVKGNVQIISRLANTMKNNATEEQLKTFAVNILKLHK